MECGARYGYTAAVKVGSYALQAVVDRLLGPPPFTAGAEAMQAYLKLLTEAYKRIFTLADALQACVRLYPACSARRHLCISHAPKPALLPPPRLWYMQQLMKRALGTQHRHLLPIDDALSICCLHLSATNGFAFGQEAVGDAAKVREHVDAVFNTTLIQHPDLERRWLQLAFGEKASQVGIVTGIGFHPPKPASGCNTLHGCAELRLCSQPLGFISSQTALLSKHLDNMQQMHQHHVSI